MLQVDATLLTLTLTLNTLMLNKVPQSAAAESFCTEGIGFVVNDSKFARRLSRRTVS